MADLKYDISVLGVEKVKRALTTIEKEFAKHERHLRSKLGTGLSPRNAAKAGYAGPGGVSAAHSVGLSRQAMTFAAREHANKMASIKRVEAAQISSIKRVEAAQIGAVRKQEQMSRQREQQARQRDRKIITQANSVGASRSRAGSGGHLANGVRSTGRMLAGGAGLVAATVGLSLPNAIDVATENELSAVNLANKQYQKGGPSRQVLTKANQDRAAAFSKRTGRKQSDYYETVNEMITLGMSSEEAVKYVDKISDISDAKNADVGLVARGYATHANINAAQAERRTAIDVAAAGAGSLELDEMAVLRGRLGGIANRMQTKDGSDAYGQLMAFAQYNKDTTGQSAEIIGTGAASWMSEITNSKSSQAQALKSMGIEVFADEGKTQLRDFGSIIEEIREKTKGNIEMQNRLGGSSAQKFLSAIVNSDMSVTDMTNKYSGNLDMNTIRDDAAAVRNSAARQLQKNTEEFNNAVGTQLLPALTQLVPVITQLVPHIKKLLESFTSIVAWAAENPWKAVMALLAVNIAKSVAMANIGGVITTMLGKVIGGGATSTVVRTGAGAVLGGGGGAGGAILGGGRMLLGGAATIAPAVAAYYATDWGRKTFGNKYQGVFDGDTGTDANPVTVDEILDWKNPLGMTGKASRVGSKAVLSVLESLGMDFSKLNEPDENGLRKKVGFDISRIFDFRTAFMDPDKPFQAPPGGTESTQRISMEEAVKGGNSVVVNALDDINNTLKEMSNKDSGPITGNP